MIARALTALGLRSAPKPAEPIVPAVDWEAKFKKAVADLAAASDEIADYLQQVARAGHMMDQATERLAEIREERDAAMADAQKWRDSLKRSRDRKAAKKPAPAKQGSPS